MNNLICVVSVDCMVNPSKVKPFDNLSSNDSIFFYTLLLANYIELLMNEDLNSEAIFLLNKHDQEFLQKKTFPEEINYHFIDFEKHHTAFDNLNKNIFTHYHNIVLIHSRSIGIKENDMVRIFRLLSGSENNVVLGKSKTKELVFSAHNKIFRPEFESFLNNEKSFNDHLAEITKRDSYLNLMEKFFSFSTFDDFKNLYNELSTKNSLEYCSEQMHERFTNLFIEYKDELK